uniref:Aldo_ket_red domain-containing protein n=1 Tax=Onchocerca flexuosa TaxID=387005 RepID=A0A183H9A9_9BILA
LKIDDGKALKFEVVGTRNRAKEVEGQLCQSLEKLRINYADLYLIHMPTSFDVIIWMRQRFHFLRGMEDVFKKGLTKAIGVSNFSIKQIERVKSQLLRKIIMFRNRTVIFHEYSIWTSFFKFCVILGECHLYLPQFALHEVCKNHDISLTSSASFESPGRVDYEVPNREYLIERDIAVIPKSVKEHGVKENFEIFDFELTESEVKGCKNVKHCQHLFLFDYMTNHPEDPFKDERK